MNIESEIPIIDLTTESNDVAFETNNEYKVMYDIPIYPRDVEKFVNGLTTCNVSKYF
jgi:hypothetical protein